MLSRSFKKKLTLSIAPRILKWIIVIIGLTCKKKWLGYENINTLTRNNQNWIYSLWHNNITCAAFLLRKQKLLSMASSSEDGRIAAKVIELFGNKSTSGSSSRGGAKVLFAMIKGVKAGMRGAITPDGPRGPKYKLQSGVISISQKSKVPLLPFHVEATRQWVFEKSWDKHKLPKPFSTIVIGIGEPYLIPEKLTKEQFEIYRTEFEKRMFENIETVKIEIETLRKKHES
ncbi:lysophospholipid acyltransferase family protein [bacterium]|nr:lysophospholipid acyltransferase family protein [bacterium]